jgi:hypothetical protein
MNTNVLMNNFLFLQTTTGGTSRRGEELEQAKARSHAAAVTHKRRKSRIRIDNEGAVPTSADQRASQLPNLHSPNSLDVEGRRISAEGPSSSRDLASLSEDIHDVYLNDPTFAGRFHEQLDPFIQLAGHTTLRERNLLHFCEGSRSILIRM